MDIPVRWRLDHTVCYAYEALRTGSSALHGHHHFLLTLITRGSGIQTLNGRQIPFSPGDLFLLSPADFHKNTLEEGKSFSYYGVKFTYELLDARLSELCALDRLPLYLHLPDQTAAVARGIFSQLVEECQNGQDRLGNRAYMQSLVEQLIILALREVKNDTLVCQEAFINRALGYLYSHFSESITVGDAAAYVGYTPNYFNTCFRQQMGVPFGEYLRQMRLNYAENLLRSSIMPVTEVAYESGFGSLSYFSRCFREKFQISPQEFRKYNHEKEQQEVKL